MLFGMAVGAKWLFGDGVLALALCNCTLRASLGDPHLSFLSSSSEGVSLSILAPVRAIRGFQEIPTFLSFLPLMSMT